MSALQRRRSGRAVVAIAWSFALPSILLGVVAACATADERTDALTPDASMIVPVSDAGEEASVVEDAAQSETCAAGELCRATADLPLVTITAMSGRSSSDVWAAGSDGVLLRWNGTEWTTVESPIHETLTSIFLTADEMWGVAGKLALRRNLDPASIRTARQTDLAVSLAGIVVLPGDQPYVGVQAGWSYFSRLDMATAFLEPQPEAIHPLTQEPQWFVTPHALFLVPDHALWLVGDHGTVVRYPISAAPQGEAPLVGQGVMLPVASQSNLVAAWGRDQHLWATGGNGTILHFDGTKWQIQNTGTTATIQAVFGFALDDVWAAGDDGTVLHFDGHAWSPVGVGRYRGALRAIWGAAPDDVWFGGEGGIFHWGAKP